MLKQPKKYYRGGCGAPGKIKTQKKSSHKGLDYREQKNGRPCFANSENSLKLKRLRVNRKWSSLR